MSVNLGSLGGLSDIGKQFLVWQVLSQIANAILGPALIEVTQDINGKVSRVALSPADAVDAVVKGHWDQARGALEATLSGIEGDRFQVLVDSAGEPPGLETLLEMYRRGIITRDGTGADSTSLEQGIRESRLKNKWVGAIEAIRTSVLTPGESVAAALRGNLPMADAEKKAYEAGISAEDFATMVANAGRPPSPGELALLVHRGLIPLEGVGRDVLSFQQGIFEGDTKDKWWRLYFEASEYVPPPRTVTALLKEGAISEAFATELFKDAGLSEQLAKIYTDAASAQHAQTHKDLTKSEVVQLYTDGLLSKEVATDDLKRLGLNETDAAALLEHPQAARERQLQNRLVGHLHTLYVAHKINEQTVLDGLADAGLAIDERNHLLKLWTLEKQLPVQHITPAEVTGAWFYDVIDDGTAMAILQNLGYGEWEAWLALMVRGHGKKTIKPEPARPPLAG